MKTIGAKELRLHLDQVLDRVLSGEEIIVSHRFKAPVRLSAVHNTVTTLNAMQLSGLAAFDSAPKHQSPYAQNAPLKELYSRSIKHKYGA